MFVEGEFVDVQGAICAALSRVVKRHGFVVLVKDSHGRNITGLRAPGSVGASSLSI
jgi:ribosomal protein L3